MSLHPRAGQLPNEEDLIDVKKVIKSYYTLKPDVEISAQKVSFGTSGHRGNSEKCSFNEDHILAITQAVCDVRKKHNIQGLLFLGKDTHALSEPAFESALEVLIANKVQVAVDKNNGYTPTPALSHAIILANKGKLDNDSSRSDGIIITPSHNPPEDGGFKYNPPSGGPADTTLTKEIEERAHALLKEHNKNVLRTSLKNLKTHSLIIYHNFIEEYVGGLSSILNMDLISSSGIKMGVDPLGGASVDYWLPIAEKYKLNLSLVSNRVDPTFRNVPFDRDGKIRMDCSSPYAMNGLLKMKDDFHIAFACDPDSDRHGIVCPTGLLNPNHYLSVVVDYLIQNRPLWNKNSMIGKTVVTSSMIDRVSASHNRKVYEVPVGFKWFVQGLLTGSCSIGLEESAGASFACFDQSPWSTDKDGLLLALLAGEITAKTGKNPATLYKEIEAKFGTALYNRIDMPASDAIRSAFKNFNKDMLKTSTLADMPINAVLTKAAGNNESIGGLKVETKEGWFAARPSGTENICKIYIEGFNGEKHFEKLQNQAVEIVNNLVK